MFRKNISPPSSRSKSKPGKKPIKIRRHADCFFLFSCLAHSSTLKMSVWNAMPFPNYTSLKPLRDPQIQHKITLFTHAESRGCILPKNSRVRANIGDPSDNNIGATDDCAICSTWNCESEPQMTTWLMLRIWCSNDVNDVGVFLAVKILHRLFWQIQSVSVIPELQVGYAVA
jgi:hypothetical protein